MDPRMKGEGGLFVYAIGYLKEKYPSLETDEESGKHAFAFCARQVLSHGINVRCARATMLGMFINDMAIPESQGEDISEGSTRATTWLRRVDKIMVPRGLTLRIAQRIPCDCLNKLAEEAKAFERVRVCDECNEVFPSNVLKTCSRCKQFRYCSTQCQHANW